VEKTGFLTILKLATPHTRNQPLLVAEKKTGPHCWQRYQSRDLDSSAAIWGSTRPWKYDHLKYASPGSTIHGIAATTARLTAALCPHTRSVLPSVLTAQLDRECVGKSVGLLQLKFPNCVTLGTAEDLTAQFTSNCTVCCFLKGEAQFVHSFNAVIIT